MVFFYYVVVLESIIKGLKGKFNFYSVDHPASLKNTQLCLVYMSTGCVTDHSVSAQSSKYEIPSLILATISRGVSVMLAVFTVLTTASTSRSTREIISAHSRQPASNRICSRYLQLLNTGASILYLLF